MGAVCDIFGPRYGHVILNMGIAPVVAAMAIVNNSKGFIVCRFLIGLSLTAPVATQFWNSLLFNDKIVGLATATANGWGDVGVGVSILLMPLICSAFVNILEPFIAWRVVYLILYALHIVIALLILSFGQDLPDGNYQSLKKKGDLRRDNTLLTVRKGLQNYRTWCLLVVYALSVGVEFTMYNVFAMYLFDQFELSFKLAGILSSIAGLTSIFAKSLGGKTSDYSSKKFGMRGRLWSLYVMTLLEGVICIILGCMHKKIFGTVICMVILAILIHASEGTCYGVVPFVSRRSLGVVSGLVLAGGVLGATVFQLVLFTDESLETYKGFKFMGYSVIVLAQLVIVIYFPMWGGMFFAPKQNITEEDYYLADYTQQEICMGHADRTIKFANETRMQSGIQ